MKTSMQIHQTMSLIYLILTAKFDTVSLNICMTITKKADILNILCPPVVVDMAGGATERAAG